jgi:hypothetical protein
MKKVSVNKIEGNVIHINYGQKQVANELKRKIKAAKNTNESNEIPYTEWLRKMNNKFMVREAGNHFIKNRLQGMENDYSCLLAKDKTKSEGIKQMALEILRVASLYKDEELTIAHINNIELLAKDFVMQVEFMDKNSNNKFTHFLSDMEMLHQLSEEKKEEILNGKKE